MSHTPPKVQVINVWADENGVSHFRDIEIDMKELAPGLGHISDPIKTTNLWFRRSPEAQDSDWHTAPRKQFVITLTGGTGEVTVSDGETRLIAPGQIVLVEDTFGKGHQARAFDGLPRNAIFIGVAE
jgi:hypothetical protein